MSVIALLTQSQNFNKVQADLISIHCVNQSKGETILTKSVNSCFIGTTLKEILDLKNCGTLVITSLTTDHCVSTTRMASNYGYNCFLISDATATFNRIGVNDETYDSELVHFTALANLKDEFATILSSNELLKLL
jgi:nicotinamidase-related amidase